MGNVILAIALYAFLLVGFLLLGVYLSFKPRRRL